jgi:hypothetical protein
MKDAVELLFKRLSKNGRRYCLRQLIRNPSSVFPQYRIRVICSHLLRLLFEAGRLLPFERSESQFSQPYVLVVQHALRHRTRHFREVAQRCCCCDSYHGIGAAGSCIYDVGRSRSVDNACSKRLAQIPCVDVSAGERVGENPLGRFGAPETEPGPSGVDSGAGDELMRISFRTRFPSGGSTFPSDAWCHYPL